MRRYLTPLNVWYFNLRCSNARGDLYAVKIYFNCDKSLIVTIIGKESMTGPGIKPGTLALLVRCSNQQPLADLHVSRPLSTVRTALSTTTVTFCFVQSYWFLRAKHTHHTCGHQSETWQYFWSKVNLYFNLPAATIPYQMGTSLVINCSIWNQRQAVFTLLNIIIMRATCII